MTRWEPNSRARLQQAALKLYGERGFDSTTVAEIAERAGLTERTFFRHFADKREVLFAGSEEFQQTMIDAVAGAPDSATPLEAVEAALAAAAAFLPDRELAHQRQVIISATPELQERELHKLASLSAALSQVLRSRGLNEPAALLTAELTMAVFRVAFERWVEGTEQRDLMELMQESLDQLRAVAAAT